MKFSCLPQSPQEDIDDLIFAGEECHISSR